MFLLRGLSTGMVVHSAAECECCYHSATLVAMLATARSHTWPAHQPGGTCIFLAAPTQLRACVVLCMCMIRAIHRLLPGSLPAWWCTRPQAVSVALIPPPLSPCSPPHALTHGPPTHAGCTCIFLGALTQPRACVLLCVCIVRATHRLLRGLSTGVVVHLAAACECCPHSATLVAMLAIARSHTWPAHPG